MYENRIIRKQEACMLIISITFNNQVMFYCMACVIEIEYYFFEWIGFFLLKITSLWDIDEICTCRMQNSTYMQNDR